MADFIIGEYGYTIESTSDKTVSCSPTDNTKTSYGAIPKTVTHNGVTYTVNSIDFYGCTALTTAPTIPNSVRYMYASFHGCTALTTAPTIPNSVWTMESCFHGCTALTTAPTIPNSVENIKNCFHGCTALTTVPPIPNSVWQMDFCFSGCTSLTTVPPLSANVEMIRRCFYGCTSLTGNIVINDGGRSYESAFEGTQKGIWLTGSSTKLSEIAATATNNNVFVGEIPLSYSLDIERVAGDGGTVQDPEGLWAHIQLTINWADFTENSIDAITLLNGAASTSPTWYTDAAKTSAITLPNWRPSASTTIHCWLAITSATHVFSVTVADRYHTGVVIAFTVPQQFRTMDFLAGGQGVAFGMPATQSGLFINMDASFLKDIIYGLEYSGTPPNATGRDAAIINAIYKIGWENVVAAQMLGAKNLLTKILNNMPQIRHKKDVALGQVAAGAVANFPITFDEPMHGAPTVVCSLYSTSTAAAIGSITASAISETAGGFTCRVFNNSSSARTPALSYIAFYAGGKD